MRLVMIDNYDSFTWNLVQQFESITGSRMEVVRNDAFEPQELLDSRPQAVIVSPGPGTPQRAGRVLDLIRANDSVPLLGVCLGHQAIGEAFGARVVRGPEPVHGKVSFVRHGSRNLFAGAPPQMEVARYHSLVVDRESLPKVLEVDAETSDGVVMALTHTERPMWGVQFHPESYGTRGGDVIAENFLRLAGLL